MGRHFLYHGINTLVVYSSVCCEKKGKVVSVTSMEAYRKGRVLIHLFLTSAYDIGERLYPRPDRFAPTKGPRCPLNGSRYGRFGEEKQLLSLPGFEPISYNM